MTQKVGLFLKFADGKYRAQESALHAVGLGTRHVSYGACVLAVTAGML